jgi:hypothetical protein
MCTKTSEQYVVSIYKLVWIDLHHAPSKVSVLIYKTTRRHFQADLILKP